MALSLNRDVVLRLLIHSASAPYVVLPLCADPHMLCESAPPVKQVGMVSSRQPPEIPSAEPGRSRWLALCPQAGVRPIARLSRWL